MMICRFKNQFLICGELSEYNIEILVNKIKAKISIKCNNRYYLCRFNINKEYQKQEYYNFLRVFGIPYEWIKDIDNDEYKIYDDLLKSSLGGIVSINHRVKRLSGENKPSLLMVGGNLLQWQNKTIFSANFLDETYKKGYSKLTIDTVCIGKNKFYNKLKGKVNIMNLVNENYEFHNGYVYRQNLEYQLPFIDDNIAHDYQEPILFIIDSKNTGRKLNYQKVKQEILDYKREQQMIKENEQWLKKH
jgi:hypothetical protein